MPPLVGNSNVNATPAVTGTHTAGGLGLEGTSNTSTGVYGLNATPSGVVIDRGAGVWGDSTNGVGVHGTSRFIGVQGDSTVSHGVYGINQAQSGISPDKGAGVWGDSQNGFGVFGTSTFIAVVGRSTVSHGVYGINQAQSGISPDEGAGVWGDSQNGYGVVGTSQFTGVIGQGAQVGINGNSPQGIGVIGHSTEKEGVKGVSAASAGVHGTSGSSFGVQGDSDHSGFTPVGSVGVWGDCGKDGIGVACTCGAGGFALFAHCEGEGQAGVFEGSVSISGSLTKAGGGFRIDHPREPARKYLNHSFVESSERKNVYDGVAFLDNNGEGTIEFPSWFEMVNQDFRYQVTAIGGPAPNLHIAHKVRAGRLKISGGVPGMEVSWQVTGIRRDAWAQAHPLIVEEDKSKQKQNQYLHPEVPCRNRPTSALAR